MFHLLKKLKLSPSFVLIILLYAVAGNLALLPLILAALLVHESAHIAVIRLCGLKILRIEANVLGFIIYTNAALSSYLKDTLTALSGPAASILAAYAASWLANRGYFSDHLFAFSGLSLLYGFFNLLPCLPLDGGRAFYALSHIFLPPDAARITAVLFHYAAAAIVISCGIFVLIHTKYNLSLLLIGVWLVTYSLP
ncbi:MAG: site-2 protease family protein [Bacillota bacterium]|nr:site-2 protease family protein [Bacillota bacterium]